MIHSSVHALLSGLIDYAGLFQPASLDMATAVANYQSYRKGQFSWALGRFVAAAPSIAEVRAQDGGKEIAITALIGANLEAELELAQAAGVDTVELKAATPAQIRSAAEKVPEGLTAYFEIPLTQDPRKCVEAIGETGMRAKVRTGGLTVDAFPGSRDLARFLQACVDYNVQFKATAGLHHAVRSVHALNAGDGPTTEMHGFLNLFLGAAFVRAGMEPVQTVRLLEDQSPQSFHFDQDRIGWRDESLDTGQIADARKNLAIGFGSCSFEEPIAELKKLGVL